MLSLAAFGYPIGINAIIGVIGSIGMSINAAIIILTDLQGDPAAARGNPGAMAGVVMGSSRHIVSTTITTFGDFLPLIFAGGGFWPPFAMSIAGGVLLSAVVSFYVAPPLFVLARAGHEASGTDTRADRPARGPARAGTRRHAGRRAWEPRCFAGTQTPLRGCFRKRDEPRWNAIHVPRPCLPGVRGLLKIPLLPWSVRVGVIHSAWAVWGSGDDGAAGRAGGAVSHEVRLEERVPTGHLLRRVDAVFDLSFAREVMAPHYAQSGRPSTDPEFLLRMLLVGYLHGVRSERRLCEEVDLNLAHRWFCRPGLDGRVPDHSTFTKNRRGRFRDSGLMRELFERVVEQCLAAGLANTDHVVVDGTHDPRPTPQAALREDAC